MSTLSGLFKEIYSDTLFDLFNRLTFRENKINIHVILDPIIFYRKQKVKPIKLFVWKK